MGLDDEENRQLELQLLVRAPQYDWVNLRLLRRSLVEMRRTGAGSEEEARAWHRVEDALDAWQRHYEQMLIEFSERQAARRRPLETETAWERVRRRRIALGEVDSNARGVAEVIDPAAGGS